MKKLIPVVLIGSAVIASGCSIGNWFNRNKEPEVQNASDYGSGIQIEELSDEQESEFLNTPVADLETVQLEKPATDAPVNGSGMVRYEYTDQGVTFLVTTDLAAGEKPYSVWLRSGDKDNLTLAFKLEEGKGGAWGSASVPASQLPVEVLVSSGEEKASVPDQTVLRATIPVKPTE